MQKIVGRVIVIVGILIATLLGVKQVQAIGCVVYDCSHPCNIDGIEQMCQAWCNGDCGGTDNGGCPPNTHINPNGSCGDNGTGGEETCFPAGTGITMSDGGRKNIEDVRVGEQVLSRRESGEVTSSRVEQVLSPVSDSMCRIGFASGESLEVTESHPLYTREGWKAIDTDVAARERESVAVTALGVGEDGRLGFYGRGLD